MQALSHKWIVAHLGAREHYNVPLALYRRGLLRTFYTDAWCQAGRSILSRLPEPVRSFANRWHPELENARVISFTAKGLWDALRYQTGRRISGDFDVFQYHNEVGSAFAQAVADHIEKQHLNPRQIAFLGFSTGSYEALVRLGEQGFFSVLNQISPGPIEKDIVQEEMKRWPGWSCSSPENHEMHSKRIVAEWEAATLILVNSEWSRKALVQQRVPEEKIVVVPLAYEPPCMIQKRATNSSGTLRVLWLGNVILRKGIPYLIEAARRLQGHPISFDVVGPIGISSEVIARAPSNITFHGRASRDDVATVYSAADVFVLPTLSDGFAITQLEAMAHGLPVIATPNCGQVVTDGIDGFIVEPRNSEAIANAILTLARDSVLLRDMSRQAIEKAKCFTVDQYAQRFLEAVSPHLEAHTQYYA